MVLFAGVAEVARVSNFVSFEPDQIEVFLDERRLALEPGQAVKEHGIDLKRTNGSASLG